MVESYFFSHVLDIANSMQGGHVQKKSYLNFVVIKFKIVVTEIVS